MKELLKHGKRYAPLSLSEVVTGSTITGSPNIAQMRDDAVFKLKAELRKMRKGDFLRMVLSQKERKCAVGGVCPFLLEYDAFFFVFRKSWDKGARSKGKR
jgi:hypothetical protein